MNKDRDNEHKRYCIRSVSGSCNAEEDTRNFVEEVAKVIRKNVADNRGIKVNKVKLPELDFEGALREVSRGNIRNLDLNNSYKALVGAACENCNIKDLIRKHPLKNNPDGSFGKM